MPIWAKTGPMWAKTGATAVLVCGLALSLEGAAADPSRNSGSASTAVRPGSSGSFEPQPDRTLSRNDRLSVIAAAMDPKVRQHSVHDCSHLVHAIYEKAGFRYTYASSTDLYLGVEGFQRVPQPQPGDLVVWRGHVGIVIRPSQHIFFSLMTSGPGIADYGSQYGTSRGRARFL